MVPDRVGPLFAKQYKSSQNIQSSKTRLRSLKLAVRASEQDEPTQIRVSLELLQDFSSGISLMPTST